jgi:hypothetical protein
MNNFNHATVVPDKRDKYLDDAYEKDLEDEKEEDEE